MFICGSWKKVVEGPLHARRTLVYRCDMAEGHTDEYHRDNVLAVHWLDADSDPECKLRNEWNPPAPRATGESALYPIQRFRAAVSEGKNICPIVVPNDKGPLVYYGEHREAMDDLLNAALGPLIAEEMWKFHEGGRVDVLITAFLASRKLRLAAKPKAERVKIERSPGIPPRWIVLLDEENPFNGVFCREKDAERYAAGLRAEIEKEAKP